MMTAAASSLLIREYTKSILGRVALRSQYPKVELSLKVSRTITFGSSVDTLRMTTDLVMSMSLAGSGTISKMTWPLVASYHSMAASATYCVSFSATVFSRYRVTWTGNCRSGSLCFLWTIGVATSAQKHRRIDENTTDQR